MLRSLFVALVLAGCAFGQVEGPTELKVPVGRLAALPLSVQGGAFEYAVFGVDCDSFREFDPDPIKFRLRVIGYQPGTAWVVVSSQNAGKLQPLFVCRVTFEGKGPVPPPDPPGPGPQPGPDPPAPKSAAWVVLITDQDADSPGAAAVIASRKFRDQLGNWGLRLRVYDKSSPVVAGKGYGPHLSANRIGLPAFLALDADGQLVGAATLPGEESAALEAIRKAAGK